MNILKSICLIIIACNLSYCCEIAKGQPYFNDLILQGAAFSDLQLVKIAIENKADVNATNQIKQTPLMIASYLGNFSIAKVLIDANAFLEAKDQHTRKAIHFASQVENNQVLGLLINSKASINTKGGSPSGTALHFAIIQNAYTSVKTLIENNADLEILNKAKETPLIAAMSVKNPNASIIEFLLKSKADIKRNLYANISKLENPYNFNIVEMAKFNKGQMLVGQPIHHAALKCNVEIIKLLVEHKAQINSRNSLKQTPALLSLVSGNSEALKFFLKNKADLNNCILFSDIIFLPDNANCIKLLLEYGITINEKIRNSRLKLLSVDGKSNDILRATIFDKTDMVTALLKLNRADLAQLNAKDATGTTPLMWAAARGNSEIVKALLDYRRENKIFIDLLESNNLGENAIDLAFEHDKLTSLKRLQKATYIQAKTVIGDALLKLIMQASENSIERIETKQPYNPNLFVIIIAQYLSGVSGNVCNYCNAPEAENSCPCYQAKYCSKDCQKKHWKNHKVQCPEKIKKDDEIEVEEENNDNIYDLEVD